MKLFLVSAIGIVILIVLLIIVVRYNRKLVAKNHDLFQKNLDILALKKTSSDFHCIFEYQKENDNAEGEKDSDSTPEPTCRGNVDVSSDHSDGEGNKSKGIGIISDSDMESLWKNISSIMKDEVVFCSPDFSLQKLSDMLDSNTKYVSYTINRKTGQSFTAFLSEKRIDVACRRFIDNENYGHYTLEAIITEVGYKSRSAFIKTFKRYIGLTPSEYRKIAIEKKVENV